MKKLFVFLLIFIAVKAAKAQYRNDKESKMIFLSAGPEIGAPSNTPYNLSYGGSATAEAKVMNQLGLTITAGYTNYKYKSSIFGASNIETHPTFVPLKAGVKFYTSPSFYVGGELGSTIQSNNNIGSLFVYSLGFGFEIPVNPLSDIEVGFRYENYSKTQYQTTALRVAYRIGW